MPNFAVLKILQMEVELLLLIQELLEHSREAQLVQGTPWKCVLKFVHHLMPAFMELVLEVALDGVLLGI